MCVIDTSKGPGHTSSPCGGMCTCAHRLPHSCVHTCGGTHMYTHNHAASLMHTYMDP